MRGSRPQLKQEKFTLERKANLFPYGDSPKWSRVPREAVLSASLGLFKSRLEKALNHIITPGNRRLHWGPPDILSNMKFPLSP